MDEKFKRQTYFLKCDTFLFGRHYKKDAAIELYEQTAEHLLAADVLTLDAPPAAIAQPANAASSKLDAAAAKEAN